MCTVNVLKLLYGYGYTITVDHKVHRSQIYTLVTMSFIILYVLSFRFHLKYVDVTNLAIEYLIEDKV